jgi:ElaB/YqjD/DUF883 family membrane-anchored ribosome-binding protein
VQQFMQENSMSTPIRPLSSTDFPAPAARLYPAVADTDRLLPEAEDRSRLESAAETVGNTLGRAVNKVRDIPRRFTVIRGGAGDKSSEMMEQASAKYDDLKVQASHKLDDLKVQTRNRAQLLRARARHYIYEYPLQCLGGVFGAAVLTGMALRIWRTRD